MVLSAAFFQDGADRTVLFYLSWRNSRAHPRGAFILHRGIVPTMKRVSFLRAYPTTEVTGIAR